MLESTPSYERLDIRRSLSLIGCRARSRISYPLAKRPCGLR